MSLGPGSGFRRGWGRLGHRSVGQRDRGQGHRVICVTHLSQIAAFAEWHITVQKRAIHGGTVVGASRRCAKGRVRELKEMMRTSAKAGKSIAMQMFEVTRQIRQKILATAWAAPVLVDAASQLSRGRGKGEG